MMMGIWPDSVFCVRVWPVRLALLICNSMHYVISVFLEMFLCFCIFFFFFGGERACPSTHAKVAGTRLPFSKYSGTAHAQMCCHPETKSKVRPRKKNAPSQVAFLPLPLNQYTNISRQHATWPYCWLLASMSLRVWPLVTWGRSPSSFHLWC